MDWYSSKILAWGLFEEISQFEVLAVVADAVSIEEIDLLPQEALRLIVVTDHGSENTAADTKGNIKVQGLELRLSGIGRITESGGRISGTLKRDEI